MDQVNHLISRLNDIERRICQEISSSSLHCGLKDTTPDQLVSCPLASVGVLTMHRNTILSSAPRSSDQLELWPLPADQAA